MIYLITCLFMSQFELNQYPKRIVHWGYFNSKDDAEHAVLNDETNMFENGYYNMAVICKVPEGLLQLPEEELFFSYDYEKKTVTKIEKPRSLEHIVFGFV